MAKRIIPRPLLPSLLKTYGAALAAGVIFGILRFALSSQTTGRAELVAVSVGICLAIGGLFVGFFIAQLALAAGESRWTIFSGLFALALLPGILIYVSPVWGVVCFATIPLALIFALVEPRSLEKE